MVYPVNGGRPTLGWVVELQRPANSPQLIQKPAGLTRKRGVTTPFPERARLFSGVRRKCYSLGKIFYACSSL